MKECFESIGSWNSAKELLNVLQDENTGEFRKKTISHILHGLELGKVGVKDNRIVEYFRDYRTDIDVSSAMRLTSDGKIAVFDDEEGMLGYFEMGDLSNDEEIVDAKVLSITAQGLFVPKPGETEEEKLKREEYVELFKKDYLKIIQDKIFEKTNVRLNSLTLKEQVWWLIYFDNADDSEKERVRGLLEKHGEQGVKTFLAMEHDEHNGEVILNLGGKFDTGVAKKIFGIFNEVASFVNKSNKELSERFFKVDKTVEPASEIIKRAQAVLVEYNQSLEKLDYENLKLADRLKVNQEIKERLNNVKKDVVFFTSIFKTAFRQDSGLKFEDVKGLDFKTITADQLSKNEREEILELAHSIYSDNKAVLDEVLIDIQTALDKGDQSQWYILKQDGKLLSSIRFDDLEDGGLYAGSFMVNQKMAGSAIGSVMERESMDFEAQGHQLHGIVEMQREVASHYVEKKNYIIDGIERDDEANVHLFKILRDDEVNSKYSARQLTEQREISYSLEDIKNDIEATNLQSLYEAGKYRELKMRDRFAVKVNRGSEVK